MYPISTFIFLLCIGGTPYFIFHGNPMNFCACFDERPGKMNFSPLFEVEHSTIFKIFILYIMIKNGVSTTKILKYVWPLFNIMHERFREKLSWTFCSSFPEVFDKKAILKTPAIFTCAGVSFLIQFYVVSL